MAVFKSILLAISTATLAISSPIGNYNVNDKASHVARAAPISYTGPWQNFPGASTWLSYDQIFEINKPYMAMTGSTPGDIAKIDAGVRAISASAGVPANVLLSIIMQESHGNVGAPATYSPENIPTGGLMQCYGCPGYAGQHGLTQDQVNGMIQGGAEHYRGNTADWGDNAADPATVYPALREYNSGNVNPDNLSDGRGATDAYVSDVSQRLGGWAD